MATISKTEQMNEAQTQLADVSADPFVSDFNDIASALQDFEDCRQEAETAFADALGYHEGREWEARNESLDTARDQVDGMDAALGILDDKVMWHRLDEELKDWHQLVDDLLTSLDTLVDA